MARKCYPATDPREWISRPRSNLALAQAEVTRALFEDLCFEAQQVDEMAIKAVFVHRRVPFPFVHELDRLLELLEHNGVSIPRYVKGSRELTANEPFMPLLLFRSLSGSLNDEFANDGHRQEEMLWVVEKRYEPELLVEFAGGFVDGIDLDGTNTKLFRQAFGSS